MTPLTVNEAIQQAYHALQRGDKRAVRHLAELALAQDAALEEPWLLLAAVSTPRASVEFIQRALQANPGSERAKKGMDWALKRLREAEAKRPTAGTTQPVRSLALTQPVKHPQTEQTTSRTQPVRVAKLPAGEKRAPKIHILPLVFSFLACLLITAFFLGGAQALINNSVALSRGAVGRAAADIARSTATAIPTLTPVAAKSGRRSP